MIAPLQSLVSQAVPALELARTAIDIFTDRLANRVDPGQGMHAAPLRI
jgi:hypothetical protein